MEMRIEFTFQKGEIEALAAQHAQTIVPAPHGYTYRAKLTYSDTVEVTCVKDDEPPADKEEPGND